MTRTCIDTNAMPTVTLVMYGIECESGCTADYEL